MFDYRTVLRHSQLLPSCTSATFSCIVVKQYVSLEPIFQVLMAFENRLSGSRRFDGPLFRLSNAAAVVDFT